MRFFDNFERRFLFGLTRLVAMALIFSLLVAIAVGGVLFGGGLGEPQTTKVSTDEVMDAIRPPPVVAAVPKAYQPSQTTLVSNELPNVKMPFVLQKHFSSPENLRILKDWLDDLPRERRQEFIDEMAAATGEAEEQKLDPTAAINKYRTIKMEKLEAERLAKAQQQTLLLQYAGATAVGIALIALFSLILVLLAIERNTRRVQA
jgi:hypothetical protein